MYKLLWLNITFIHLTQFLFNSVAGKQVHLIKIDAIFDEITACAYF